MNFFNQIYQKIFTNQTDSETLPVEVREPLKRNESYQKIFQDWVASERKTQRIQPIAKAYHFKKANIHGDIRVHLLRSGGANGFAVTHHPDFEKDTLSFLLEYWKQKTEELGYQLQVAERQISEKTGYIQTKEKYYLKPSIRLDTIQNRLCNQLYGNVLLEYIQIDGLPSYLKVLVTYYVDAQFSKALEYDDFVRILFEEPSL